MNEVAVAASLFGRTKIEVVVIVIREYGFCSIVLACGLFLGIAVYVIMWVCRWDVCVCVGWLTYTVDACQIAARTRGRCMELFLLARRRMELLLLEKLLLLLVSSNAVLGKLLLLVSSNATSLLMAARLVTRTSSLCRLSGSASVAWCRCVTCGRSSACRCTPHRMGTRFAICRR